ERGYKKVLLPLFDEFKQSDLALIRSIINSYNDQNVVFVAEQDQFYFDQFGVLDELKKKFYKAEARKNDKLLYSKETFNIAIHIRRGDITVGQKNKNPNLLMRWQDSQYFEKVLKKV